MRNKNRWFKKIIGLSLVTISCMICLLNSSQTETVKAAKSVATHIGTFEGSTTFVTSSSNGINPGLFIEVMDDDGNLTQYESEEGVITVPDTKEGAYVTQAKLLGKTKYMDQDTGEILDQFEEGRNLTLASVENPILTTTGKNLFDVNKIKPSISFGMTLSNDNNSLTLSGVPTRSYGSHPLGLSVEGGKTYSFQVFVNEKLHTGVGFKLWGWDSNGQLIVNTFSDKTFTPPRDASLAFVWEDLTENVETTIENITIQIEENSQTTVYQPYQSSIVTSEEDIMLQSLPNGIRDELNLITGERIQRIAQVVLDGTQPIVQHDVDSWNNQTVYGVLVNPLVNDIKGMTKDEVGNFNFLSDRFVFCYSKMDIGWVKEGMSHHAGDNQFRLAISHSKLTSSDAEGVKHWLQVNPVTVQYELKVSTNKTVRLNSNYFFKAVTNQNIQVNGDIKSLVVSITVPTEPLSFTLDPNQEAGHQFIAPEFSLINETFAPLQVELKTFEQTTDVLKDVLPEAHENWNELNKTESKDIALALVPMSSDGWLSLNEEPRYVATTSNKFIGTVKGESAVDFTFDALHGRAFSEVLNPQYRLKFVFGFSQ